MMIGFTRPLYLLLLNLIPLIILIHFLMLKRRRSHALHFANFEAIARVKGVDLLSKNLFILILTVIITALVALSLAGLNVQRTIQASSFSFAIAIDTSKSMEATDFSPNRLEVAKQTALSFVDSTSAGTDITVISFSGNSFIEQVLTQDKLLVKKAIREIQLSVIGGTDLSEAVITSTNLLEGAEAKSVILLSDGQINVGTVDQAIDYANKKNVMVHTIAMGTKEGGATSFGLSTLDEDALKALAYNTNGQFFQATDKDSLQDSFSEILDFKLRKVSFDVSSYLLLVAVLLIVVEYILINTRYKILP